MKSETQKQFAHGNSKYMESGTTKKMAQNSLCFWSTFKTPCDTKLTFQHAL